MDLEALLRARDLSLQGEHDTQPPAAAPAVAPNKPKPKPKLKQQQEEEEEESLSVGPVVPLLGAAAAPFPAFSVTEEEEWVGDDGVDGGGGEEMEARLRRYLQEEEDRELAAFILRRGAKGKGRGKGGDGDSDDSDSDGGSEAEGEGKGGKGRAVVVVKGCEDEAYEKGPAAEEAFLRFQVRAALSVGGGGG